MPGQKKIVKIVLDVEVDIDGYVEAYSPNVTGAALEEEATLHVRDTAAEGLQEHLTAQAWGARVVARHVTGEILTRFSDADRINITRAFGSMPYGAGAHTLGRGFDTVPGLLSALHGLRETLEHTAERDNRQSAELEQLHRDIAGVRRLFGIPTSSEEVQS